MNEIDVNAIINKYYPENNKLKHILVTHSSLVAKKALDVLKQHPELQQDETFIYNAAMLHDIGIFLTDAPSIHCHGKAPYMQHGRLGAELMRKEGFPDIARVCERHTGTGLTAEAIIKQGIPIPPADYRPETIAEKIICYADKFFSKTHLTRERSVDETIHSLQKFGDASVATFMEWEKTFGNNR